jgi:23S rRNA pseudouridine2605 synthase
MWTRSLMPTSDPAPSGDRLQKVLAAAGVGSRRGCEVLIEERRVTVNGKVAKLGDRVDPVADEIYVDGQRVITDVRLVYLALNKPRGVVSTMDDELGRTAIADIIGRLEQRVYHVGRLDTDSEGLLIVTNDGALAHRLMHPSFGVAKTYVAEVPGPVRKNLGRELRAGVELDDGLARVDSFRLVDSAPGKVLVEIVLHEGRTHIVRRLLEAVGYPVSRLIRTQIGPVTLGTLKPGKTRRLTPQEVAALFALTAAGTGGRVPPKPGRFKPSGQWR